MSVLSGSDKVDRPSGFAPIAESDDERVARERISLEYLPAWCSAQEQPVDLSTFDPDWSFLTPGMALWFLRAIDAAVVEILHGRPTLPDSRHTYLFERSGSVAKVYREGVVEVAAAGMLALRYGWPSARLTFQSPKRGRARVWAFDLLAYADDDRSHVAVAGEAKWRQRDAVDLDRALTVCGERGEHLEADCSYKRSDHRKYEGLLAFRPHVLWIIGPESFTEDPGLVFRVCVAERGKLRLEPVPSNELAMSALTA